MKNNERRNEKNHRTQDHIRPLLFQPNVSHYAEGSVLIHMGNTQVLCTASLEESVPSWLKGKGQGWITAEYSMLPRATHTRHKRERDKISGRTQEIQRLIARSLRSCVDLSLLGERSIIIDCDVLQADGGTRTASINGGAVALAITIKKLIRSHHLLEKVWKGFVSAISMGIIHDTILADLNYHEDSQCSVDMNFVFNHRGDFIEVQGTGEKNSFNFSQLSEMSHSAQKATHCICQKQQDCVISLF